jgi:hypothetical protein
MYDGQEVEVSQQQSEQLPEPDLLDADLLESENIQLVDGYREDVGQESDLGVRNELSSGVRDEFGSGVRSGSDLGVHEGPVDTAQLESEPMNERPLDTITFDVPQQEPRQSRREGLRPREHGNIGDKPMRWEERRKLKLERAESEYGLRISVTKAIKSLGKAAVKSIVKELVGIHNEKAWEPVRMRDLSYKQKSKIVRSFLFLKEKYTSTGEFEKLKARLVAGGHMQDRSEYTEAETSSPTVSLSALYIVAAVAAKERRKCAIADVGQAFLKAELNREVILNLEPRLAKMLADELPEYVKHINEDGSLTLRFKMALYGLIESSRLWYETLSKFLKERGFVENPQDPCVLNIMHNGCSSRWPCMSTTCSSVAYTKVG